MTRQIQQLEQGLRCAKRILELADNPEYGIGPGAKIAAACDVVNVALARANGETRTISKDTAKVMNLVLSDVEIRLLYDRLGLTHWSSL